MERILKTILYFLLIGLVLLAGYGVYRVWRIFDPKDPVPRITVSDLRWNNLPPIVLPANLATNLAASNAAYIANQYQTNEPYIVASNGRIYAGLYDRDWSISYKIDNPYLHEVGIIVGGVNGIYYKFNPIGRLSVGGVVVYDGEEISFSGMAGWKF